MTLQPLEDKYDRAFALARTGRCDLLTALAQIEAEPALETAQGVQALIDTLQSALEQAHTLWAAIPVQSALAAQLCAIDQSLQRLIWQAGHVMTDIR